MMEKEKLIKRLTLIILSVVGAALTIGGGCLYWYAGKIEKEYKPVIAKIENIEKHTERRQGETKVHHYVTVSYEVDGVYYKNPINEYSSSMEIGESINLMYNPADPNEVRSTEIERVLAIILMAVGVFLLIITWLVVPLILKRVSLNQMKLTKKVEIRG